MAGINELLDQARRRLIRVTAEQAAAEQAAGALLVDTRTSEQRSRDGQIPGALEIDRTVFQSRLDPTSRPRIPGAKGNALRVIVLCAQGFSSCLATSSFQDL